MDFENFEKIVSITDDEEKHITRGRGQTGIRINKLFLLYNNWSADLAPIQTHENVQWLPTILGSQLRTGMPPPLGKHPSWNVVIQTR